MRASVFGVLLVACLVSPIQAFAQPVAPGDVIQFRTRPTETADVRWATEPTRPRWTDGTLVRLTEDALLVRVGGRRSIDALELGATDVRRATGRDRRVAGAVIGGAVGGAIGALAAYVAYEPEYRLESIGSGLVCALNNCTPPQSNSRGGETAVGAVGGVALGILAGYVVGRGVGRWESVELEPVVTPTGTVSMSLRLLR